MTVNWNKTTDDTKSALTTASPEERTAVVVVRLESANVAVPDTTVHLTKLNPQKGVVVMVVAAPLLTVRGELDGTEIMPPVPA
jgi:hypothetical protein